MTAFFQNYQFPSTSERLVLKNLQKGHKRCDSIDYSSQRSLSDVSKLSLDETSYHQTPPTSPLIHQRKKETICLSIPIDLDEVTRQSNDYETRLSMSSSDPGVYKHPYHDGDDNYITSNEMNDLVKQHALSEACAGQDLNCHKLDKVYSASSLQEQVSQPNSNGDTDRREEIDEGVSVWEMLKLELVFNGIDISLDYLTHSDKPNGHGLIGDDGWRVGSLPESSKSLLGKYEHQGRDDRVIAMDHLGAPQF